MEEENVARQADEVEALASIYGDEWCVVDEADRTFCISVTDGEVKAVYSLCLQISLPPAYPSNSPPQYQLNAPWLRGQDRVAIQNVLEDIYVENMGESIIYMWVEKLREILLEQTQQLKESGGTAPSPSKMVNISEEADSDEDSFEYDATELSAHHEEMLAPSDTVIELPDIFQGKPLSDRKSTFQAFLAKITHKKQVQMVLDKLKENKKIANATHNIYAYRITCSSPRPLIFAGCEDDGEIHAGNRMLHLLKLMDADNVIVVVARWYGGIHLGPARFKHINNCSRIILEEHGFTRESDKKTRRVDKKK